MDTVHRLLYSISYLRGNSSLVHCTIMILFSEGEVGGLLNFCDGIHLVPVFANGF